MVEPRFNEPPLDEVLNIKNDILCPGQSYSKMYGIEPRYNKFFDITNIILKPTLRNKMRKFQMVNSSFCTLYRGKKPVTHLGAKRGRHHVIFSVITPGCLKRPAVTKIATPTRKWSYTPAGCVTWLILELFRHITITT